MYKPLTLQDIPGYDHTIGRNEAGTTISIVVRERIITRKIRHSVFGDCIYLNNKTYNLA